MIPSENPAGSMNNPTTTPADSSGRRSSALRAIFWGGVACGVLDLTFALVYYTVWRGAKPAGILRSIARGLLGEAAQPGGMGTTALGVFLHFVISFGAAAAYYLASRKLRVLTDHAVIGGMLYGVGVYFFMNGVVLPLSASNAPFPPVISVRILPVLGAHVFLVGLPIALAVRRWGRREVAWDGR
jgi:hypothetical protein